MHLEVLLSCMHQSDFSVIEESNLSNVNTLIINQCDSDKDIIIDAKHRVINTTTRGLSVSRNIGIHNSKGDICLICDDDERFADNLEGIIINAYQNIEDADVIAFEIADRPKTFGEKIKRLSRVDLLKVSSVQISFKKNSVLGKVEFDPFLGAGTGNGSGEENKFLLDCFKAGLKIFYVPIDILTLKESESTWFAGFNQDYFYKRGYTTRYIYGLRFAIVYGLYFVLTKRKLYRETLSFKDVIYYLFKGIRDNCIIKQKQKMLQNA